MRLPTDEQPIQALAADGADPAFRDGIRAGRLERGPHDPHLLRGEDGIERRRELAVAVMNEESGPGPGCGQILADVPGLLGDPRGGRVRGTASKEDPAGC